MFPRSDMRLISRKNPAMVVRELGADEAEAVRRFCGAGMKTEAHDAAVIKSILNEMHDGRGVQHWLECDCRGTEFSGSHQPRLTARPRGRRLHVMRLNRYGPHDCALQSFRTDPDVEDEDDEAPEPGKHRPLRPVTDTLDYLDDEHETRGNGRRQGGRRGGGGVASGRQLPKLGRILYTLLNDAGINAFTSGTTGRRADGQPWWVRVDAFAKTEEMNDSLSLGDVLFTRPWTGLASKMKEIDALRWPAGKKRSAFMLFVADAIESGTAIKHTTLRPTRITPERPLRSGGRDQRHTHPPYWVLAIVDRGRDRTARVREAFAQHAYSTDLPLPLDSNFERRTVAQLLKVIDWVRRKGVTVTLTKPLFDTEVTLDSGEMAYCRADFELEFHEVAQGPATAGPLRIVIETMGSDTGDYLRQKSGTHAIMRRRGVLCEHVVRDDNEQEGRDDAFCRRLYRCILGLAGVPRQVEDGQPRG